MAELSQSSSPRENLHALKCAPMHGPSELHQSSLAWMCVRCDPGRGGERQFIQEPITGLYPEMLHRQIRYLAEEGNWARQGEEVLSLGGEA
jgi:hypothetical protein